MYSVMNPAPATYSDSDSQNSFEDHFFHTSMMMRQDPPGDWFMNNEMIADIFTHDNATNMIPEYGNLETEWQNKHIDDWSQEDVVGFIKSELLLDFFETPDRTDGFRNISGYIFKTLSEDYCKIIAGDDVGEIIFKAKDTYLNQIGSHSTQDNNIWTANNQCVTPFTAKITAPEESLVHRRPGRPRSSNVVRRKNQKRSEKLWEFIINLLKNSKTCPDLIKWEDFQEGTFKFVQSEKVAQLWGARKKNGNMNYEKFSRALRYYYKSKILQAVPGKRLVYKFGPQAKGWRIETPLC